MTELLVASWFISGFIAFCITLNNDLKKNDQTVGDVLGVCFFMTIFGWIGAIVLLESSGFFKVVLLKKRQPKPADLLNDLTPEQLEKLIQSVKEQA
jgi:hypothetical protein